MPQLELNSWLGQIFWLIVAFTVLYILLRTLVLPRMQSIFRRREQKISGDLKRAEELQLEVQNILEDYTRAVAEARKDASKVIADAITKAEKSAELRMQEFTSEIDATTRNVLKEIDRAKSEGLSNIDQVTIDVASCILEKVLHRKFERKFLQKTLQAVK